jgi:transcriptional regulator with PAS, ATPase and Fis domain
LSLFPNLNQVALFTSDDEVAAICRHALEPEYLLRVMTCSLTQTVISSVLSSVVLVDTSSLSLQVIEKLIGLPRSSDFLFLETVSASSEVRSTLISRNFKCLPFPCDSDVLYRTVDHSFSKSADFKIIRDIRNRKRDADLSAFDDLAGTSPAIMRVKSLLAEASENDRFSVLLLGESGTGKTLAAQLIHKNSVRKHERYKQYNMASIPDGLAESYLFGTVPGAYTGAVKRSGWFAEADGGILFMDEIGEFPVHLQAKLLRVLDTGSFYSVGSDKESHVNVRCICATNADIPFLVKTGKFRQDLYYRLAEMVIHIPSLRERKEDIGTIAAKLACDLGRKISDDAVECLKVYDWPGNVREMQSFLKRCCISDEQTVISADDVRTQAYRCDLQGLQL